jgi:hypothetical protein
LRRYNTEPQAAFVPYGLGAYTLAGGSLRTSTRPKLHLLISASSFSSVSHCSCSSSFLLLLPASVSIHPEATW